MNVPTFQRVVLNIGFPSGWPSNGPRPRKVTSGPCDQVQHGYVVIIQGWSCQKHTNRNRYAWQLQGPSCWNDGLFSLYIDWLQFKFCIPCLYRLYLVSSQPGGGAGSTPNFIDIIYMPSLCPYPVPSQPRCGYSSNMRFPSCCQTG